jgi:hypothetical protein
LDLPPAERVMKPWNHFYMCVVSSWTCSMYGKLYCLMNYVSP